MLKATSTRTLKAELMETTKVLNECALQLTWRKLANHVVSHL